MHINYTVYNINYILIKNFKINAEEKNKINYIYLTQYLTIKIKFRKR
jgi:hypothetical protein